MSEHTNIEWCDSTFNPWIGCTKVSPGCDHCYAEVSTPSRTLGVVWGPGRPRHRTSPANWALPLRWNAAHAEFFAKHGRRQRVFCASLADVFDNEVDPQWRADLFRLIADTPNLDWLLLTKRIGNAATMIDQAMRDLNLSDGERLWESWAKRGAWDNVWLGISVVYQAEADRDIPKLLAIPARVRWLSMEPLLGPVDLTRIVLHSGPIELAKDAPPAWKGVKAVNIVINATETGKKSGRRAVDWVVVGGESGHDAAPMHPDWARSLRDQCAAADVPFLFKQWGEWAPRETVEDTRADPTGSLHYFPNIDLTARRVGKKASGRLLDGVIHGDYPA